MTVLHCCLLFAVFVHSCPSSFVSAQFLLDTRLATLPADTNAKKLARAVYGFTTILHRATLASDGDANIIFSPVSLYVGLAMLYAGSGGKTKSQLAEVLYLDEFDSDENLLYESVNELLQTLTSTQKDYALEIANRLYGQDGLEFKDEYLTRTDEYFKAGLEALDFQNAPARSRLKMNQWVASMTSNKVKKLFPRDAITKDTVLALASAAFLNASWLYKFNTRSTRPTMFAAPNDQQIRVPMMNLVQLNGLRYTTDDDHFRLLELPYVDEGLSMLIALDEVHDDFVFFLNARRFDSLWSEGLFDTADEPVHLSLPKFNLQQAVDLKESLEALGVRNLFENADLSSIAASESLLLSKAYHKAIVAVNEAGTEAARATGFVVGPPSTPGKTIEFIVDRAFLLLVVEKKTGVILFFGHIKSPLKSN